MNADRLKRYYKQLVEKEFEVKTLEGRIENLESLKGADGFTCFFPPMWADDSKILKIKMKTAYLEELMGHIEELKEIRQQAQARLDELREEIENA